MKALVGLSLLLATAGAMASTWEADLQAQAGPSAMVQLPSSAGTKKLVLITFEYSRKCDPGLWLLQMQGRSLGRGEKQNLLPQSNIGSHLNGKRYTGPAVLNQYANGIEIGFAMPDEMAMVVGFESINSFSFITPKGEEIKLPLSGLRNAIDKALNACVQKLG